MRFWAVQAWAQCKFGRYGFSIRFRAAISGAKVSRLRCSGGVAVGFRFRVTRSGV